MIERYSGSIELLCDGCGEAWPEIHEAGDLGILLADARAKGWRAYRGADGWQHSCPACVAEFAENRNGRRLL